MHNRPFIRAFLKNPRQVGSIIQSSPFLVNKITNSANLSKAGCVVELGAGTGAVTKKILKRTSPDCALLTFEINPLLAECVRKNIRDPRLKVIGDSAENIGLYLKQYGYSKADCIISTLPLVTLPKPTTRKILSRVYKYLASGGQYIQFQYSLLSRDKIKQFFPSMSIAFVPLNIPPAFVYVCVKN